MKAKTSKVTLAQNLLISSFVELIIWKSLLKHHKENRRSLHCMPCKYTTGASLENHIILRANTDDDNWKKKKRVLSKLLRGRGIRDNKLITKCLTNTPRHDARLKNTPRQEITCDQTKKNRTFQRLVKVSRERFVRYIFHRTGIQFLRVFKSHSFSQKGAHL